MKERDIQNQILAYLKLFGAYATRTNSGATKIGDRFIRFNSRPGCSDILACLPGGKFAAIEVKRPKKKPTDKQNQFLHGVRVTGGFGWVVESVDQLRELLVSNGYDPP